MTRTTICFLTAILAVSSALGGTGDLTFMKSPPRLTRASRVYIRRFKHGGTDEARGLVSKHAVVGTAQASAGGIQVAIDASKPDATAPDVVRLDFTGKGNFKGAPTVKLTAGASRRGITISNIAPTTIVADRGGQKVPAVIVGNYWKQQSGNRAMSLSITSAMEGTCKFGAKTYPVRVFDGNSNLAFTDALKPPYNVSRVPMPYDYIIVDTGKGDFRTDTVRTYVGQPIPVDGKWYKPAISGMKISASVLEVASGEIKVNSPRWRCTLVGKKYCFTISGGKDPVSVPADEYGTSNYLAYASADVSKPCAYIGGYGNVRGGKPVAVTSGNTVELPLGGPVTGKVTASVSGGKVRLNLVTTDALGGRISRVASARGTRPPAPVVEVVDKSDKTVYTAKLEYG